jgi:hypothetical protein
MEPKHIQNFASFTEKLKQQRAIQEEEEKSGKQEEYAQFFKKTLQKFNVTSPADLTDEKKTAFFDEISKGWQEGEGLTTSGEKMMSEGNEFTGALADAKEKGEDEFEVDGEKFKVEEELAKIAKLEGNEFTGALADAKEKGEEEFEVDGETFKVEESEKKSEVITEALSGIQRKMAAKLNKDQITDLEDAMDDIYNRLYDNEFDAKDVDGLIFAIADEVSRRTYKI